MNVHLIRQVAKKPALIQKGQRLNQSPDPRVIALSIGLLSVALLFLFLGFLANLSALHHKEASTTGGLEPKRSPSVALNHFPGIAVERLSATSMNLEVVERMDDIPCTQEIFISTSNRGQGKASERSFLSLTANNGILNKSLIAHDGFSVGL